MSYTKYTKTIVASFIGAAGIGLAVTGAPAASAGVDPCRDAVSTSRCLGPAGVQGFSPNNSSTAGTGAQNGPYGPWGNVPPVG